MSSSKISISKVSDSPLVNWRIFRLLLTSSILLSLLFSSLYYFQLKSQLDTQHTLSRAHDEQLLSLMINQSIRQFQQAQNFISTLQEVNRAIRLKDRQKLVESFDRYWADLHKTNEVNFAGFYSSNGKPLAEWPQTGQTTPPQQLYQKWINTVKNSGRNFSTILCKTSCNRYFISPLTFNNITIGFQVLAITMNDDLKLEEMSKGRITGILSPAENPETSTDILVFKWGYSINGGSILPDQQSILQEFSKQFPNIGYDSQTLHSTINQTNYELALYPLKLSDKSLLIVLDDVSNEIQKLHISAIKFAIITVLILLTLQSLLYLYLQRFYVKGENSTIQNDHEDSTQNLPNVPVKTNPVILQQHNVNQQRAMVVQIKHEFLLNNQLDLLKQYIEDINLELARQMISLSQERELVNKILDNSQALIMRLRKDGTIAAMNSYGENIIGYTTRELAGKNFIDLYPDDAPVALKDLENISSLIEGSQQQYQHEAQLKRKDGKECIILWLHTKLPAGVDTKFPILSTGLDITQQKNLERNMGWLVNHDSLTSLFNRRRFENELDLALNWAKKHSADGCLLTIDLDNFKDINDSCGHKVGDIILRKVATTLKEFTKQIDSSAHTITARLGGDEFAIILRNIDEESSIILSQRIIEALNKIAHLKRQVSFNLSSSIGIATFSVAGNNSTELLSNANYARNLAKIDGRNQFHVFRTEHSHLQQTHHRMIWRERIESALKNNRFVLYFQPILCIQHYKISHYETLIRMLDDNDGLIAPGSFIHIAEQFGLIQQIDSFIIAHAIAKQGELIRQGYDVTLTINLSAKSFDDPELFNKINRAIKLNKANPQHLVFEITETGAVSNITTAEEIMIKIKSLGCQFALDDFGIGFSSFHYLRKLPVDYVKIDGSFVIDLANNSDNKVLVQSLSDVAIGFNKLTVAEFVDSRQTLEILKQAKINFAQGYFIGKPSAQIPVQIPDILYSYKIDKAATH